MHQGATTAKATGKLNFKRVAANFKRRGLEVHVERIGNGEFFVADGFAMVRISMQHPDMPYTFFDESWKRATFAGGKGPAVENHRPDQQQFWDQFEKGTSHPLKLTHELWENPDSKKGGILWRRFTYEDLQLVERRSYFNKAILDLISPDLDELYEFTFEQVGRYGPMRVTGAFGPVAIIMPGHNIEVGAHG